MTPTMTYSVEGNDQKGKVGLKRLLTPYRFKKVEAEKKQAASEDVAVGDKFADKDKRRNRVLIVQGVDGDTVTYLTDTGVRGEISKARLLTPYRFGKVTDGKK